jgi:hypothetical protein
LAHFTVFCYILWTFGIVRGNLVYFFLFWYFVSRKIWQPCSQMPRVVFPTREILRILDFLTDKRETERLFFLEQKSEGSRAMGTVEKLKTGRVRV